METKITARYEDVLKFIENETIQGFKAALELEKQSGLPMEILAAMSARRLANNVPMIAFIYGKTQKEVEQDLSDMLDSLKEMKW